MNITTKRLTRAGIIAALYYVLTFAFGKLSYQGFFQFRPAEALCILPIFFAEAVPGLAVGCLLANLHSPFLAYDVPFGSLTTLIAAIMTFFIGRLLRKNLFSAIIGAIPPVLLNAIVIPFVIILADPKTAMNAYWALFGSLFVTQAVWIYALGIPLYFAVRRLNDKGVKFFTDK